MKSLKQISVISRMEFLFVFRRGGPLVATAVIWLLVIAGELFMLFSNFGPVDYKNYSQAYRSYCGVSEDLSLDSVACRMRSPQEELSTFSSLNLSFAWLPFFLLSFLLLPMVSALSIPSDHQFGVDELLFSMPVTGSAYLAGKCLGLSLAVILVSAVMLGVYDLIILAVYGSLSLSMSIHWIAVYGLPIAILTIMLGTSIGAFLRTRRSAIILGLLAGLIGISSWVIAFQSPNIGQTIDRLSYFIFQQNGLLHGGGVVITSGEIITMYFFSFVIVFVVGILARGWLMWKENI